MFEREAKIIQNKRSDTGKSRQKNGFTELLKTNKEKLVITLRLKRENQRAHEKHTHIPFCEHRARIRKSKTL